MPTDSKNLPSAIVCLEGDFLLSAGVCIRLTAQTFVIGLVSIIERNDLLNESKTGTAVQLASIFYDDCCLIRFSALEGGQNVC